METLFANLDRWRHFAGYPLEARVDALIGLFLPKVLEDHCGAGEMHPHVIPQFPLKKAENNQSDKVDFFAVSKSGDRAYLVEVKTDMDSLRLLQHEYLSEARIRGLARVLSEFKEIAVASKSRKKYFHLISTLSEMGLLSLPEELKQMMRRGTNQRFNEAHPGHRSPRLNRIGKQKCCLFSHINIRWTDRMAFTTSTSMSLPTAYRVLASWGACSRATSDGGRQALGVAHQVDSRDPIHRTFGRRNPGQAWKLRLVHCAGRRGAGRRGFAVNGRRLSHPLPAPNRRVFSVSAQWARTPASRTGDCCIRLPTWLILPSAPRRRGPSLPCRVHSRQIEPS